MLDFLTWALRMAALLAGAYGGIAWWGAQPPAMADIHQQQEASTSCRLRVLTAPRETRDWFQAQMRALEACPPDPRTTVDEARQRSAVIALTLAVILLILSAALGSMARREALAEESLRELRRDREHR